ncbi:hypothetical protein KAR48_01150 [bacterium]|nr:hypothetical protein [bacterium]
MSPKNDLKQRLNHLKEAFGKDGFIVKDFSEDERYDKWTRDQGELTECIVIEDERGGPKAMGLLAYHKTAKNGHTGEPKKTYYLEGSPYQMGMLMGLMAEECISVMTTKFVDNVIFELIDAGKIAPESKLFKLIKKEIADYLGQCCMSSMKDDIPLMYQHELNAMLAGCKKINLYTKVKMDDLWALNFGVDFLLAHLFTGEFFKKKRISPKALKAPAMCNAFSVFSKEKVENDLHFFGRDFMFATADVFQDEACLILYKPFGEEEEDVLPFVCQAAPGFIGAIAGVNTKGVAMGVDVFMGSLCKPEAAGFNSLVLVRDVLQHSTSIHKGVKRVKDAPRGVTWFYPMAGSFKESGQWRHESCVIEAAANIGDSEFPYLKGITKHYKKVLPTPEELESILMEKEEMLPENGMTVRWSDYQYPKVFFDYNEKLVKAYNSDKTHRFISMILDLLGGIVGLIKKFSWLKIVDVLVREYHDIRQNIVYNPAAYSKGGYLNPLHEDNNCPGPFYFAPQRDEGELSMTLVGNHPITPPMRYLGMAEWISMVSSTHINGFQWRYDELCHQLLNSESINEVKAQHLIDFLRPNNDNVNTDARMFYNPNLDKNPDAIPVDGSVSLFELTEKKIMSHFGYYGDLWVSLTLPAYVE